MSVSGCGDHSSLASEVPTTSQGIFNMYTCVCDPGTFCRESLPGREHLPCEVLDGSEEVVTSHSEYTCFGLTSETCFGEVYQCMVPPTPEPTQAPVPAPTTLEPSPAPTDTGDCPRNCGTAERGGGQCRPNGRCLSCNPTRLLSGGRCFQSIACKGRRIQGGGQAGSNCRCVHEHCHYCNRAVEGDTCRVVRTLSKCWHWCSSNSLSPPMWHPTSTAQHVRNSWCFRLGAVFHVVYMWFLPPGPCSAATAGTFSTGNARRLARRNLRRPAWASSSAGAPNRLPAGMAGSRARTSHLVASAPPRATPPSPRVKLASIVPESTASTACGATTARYANHER